MNITNSTANTTITGTSSANSIYNNSNASGVAINAGDGKDTIANYASSVTISAGAGDDTVYNHYWAPNVKIDAGEGNDTIHNNSSNNVSIVGGAGNDSINNTGYYATLGGGTWRRYHYCR